MLLALSPQGMEKENLWDSNKDLRLNMSEEQNPLFPCVFYILFRKRNKHFWHHSEAGSPNTQCAESPQSEV